MILSGMARAYVNWGRWIADCPIGCGGALKLEPSQTAFACPECRTISQIDWPRDADEIWHELEKRVIPKTRNWFPEDHELALRAHVPHGQTVTQLRDECAEHQDA
jgi:hypothetical protein